MDLVHFNKARNELALATNIDEVKDIRDKAEALRIYVKQAGESLEMQNQCAEIKIRAERRAGELLPKDKNKGAANGSPGPGRGHKTQSHDVTTFTPPKLSDLGISKMQSSRWQEIASIPEEDFEAHIAETKEKKKELTSSGVHKVAKKKKKAKAKADIEAAKTENPDAPIIHLADQQEWIQNQPEYDLLLTDPPYMTDVHDIKAFAYWLPEALARIKPTGRAYIFIGAYPEEIAAYLAVANMTKGITLANILVWTYRNTLGPSPKFDYKLNWQAILYFRGEEAPPLDCPLMTEQFSVQDINAPDGRQGDRFHTWQKPDEIAERFIRHSTKVGDIVCDPFAGTGTFLLAATMLGRLAMGCEKDEGILQIAQERGCRLG